MQRLTIDEVYEALNEHSRAAVIMPNVFMQMRAAIKQALDASELRAAEYQAAYERLLAEQVRQDKMVERAADSMERRERQNQALRAQVDTGKQQWDTLAAMLGVDGDNVDAVFQRAMNVLLAANGVPLAERSELLEGLVPPDAAYFEKLRTLQDARNYRYIRAAFDSMKTSESERFMECLGLEGDAWLPLDTLMLGAKVSS